MGVPDIQLQTVLARPSKMRFRVELAYVRGRTTVLVSHRLVEGQHDTMLCAGAGSLLLGESITSVAGEVSRHTQRLIELGLRAYAPEIDPPF